MLVKFGNITIDSKTATLQDAFQIWVNSRIGELQGPDGEMPDDDAIKEHLLEEFRILRQELLRNTDWMFLIDSPINNSKHKEKWKKWRQALRDIPQIYPDIRQAIMPQQPQN